MGREGVVECLRERKRGREGAGGCEGAGTDPIPFSRNGSNFRTDGGRLSGFGQEQKGPLPSTHFKTRVREKFTGTFIYFKRPSFYTLYQNKLFYNATSRDRPYQIKMVAGAVDRLLSSRFNAFCLKAKAGIWP